MKSKIQTNEVTELPCLMEDNYNRIVLCTYADDNKKFVTVVANKNGTMDDIGKTWQSDIKSSDYKPLPTGYQVTITN